MTQERTVKREFPRVPECARGETPSDPYRQIKAREQRAREAMIAAEEIKLLAEKVKECYRKEGVNHYRNCEDLTRAYVQLIQSPNMKARPVEISDLEH